MNLVLIAVILILALNIVLGYTQGFIKSIYSLVAWILVVVLTSFLASPVTSWVMENTPIPTQVEEYVYEQIKELAEEKKQEITEQIETQLEENTSSLENQWNAGGFSLENLEQYGIQLPKAIADKLEDINLELVPEESTEAIVDSAEPYPVYRSIAATISAVVIKGVVSVIVMIAAIIIVFALGAMLDVVAKLPVIEDANKTLGMLAGAIKGFVIIWVLMAILSFFAITETGAVLVKCIYENPLLTWIYENNPLLNLLFLFI